MVQRRRFHFRHRRPSAAPRQLDCSSSRGPARTSVFHQARTTRTEHGLGTRRSSPRTPSIERSSRFTGIHRAASNVFGCLLRSWDTLSPTAAARSVTSLPGRRAGLTLLPSDEPRRIATTSPTGRDPRRCLSPISATNHLVKRAPCASTDSLAAGSHPHDQRCLCAPQFRIAPAPELDCSRPSSALSCG